MRLATLAKFGKNEYGQKGGRKTALFANFPEVWGGRNGEPRHIPVGTVHQVRHPLQVRRSARPEGPPGPLTAAARGWRKGPDGGMNCSLGCKIGFQATVRAGKDAEHDVGRRLIEQKRDKRPAGCKDRGQRIRERGPDEAAAEKGAR